MKYDLHMHTSFSDGEYSPQKLIERAYAENIEVISITDHDTVKAYKQLEKEKFECIKIIPGIEISTRTACFEEEYALHILGYNIDIHSQKLNEELNNLEIIRMKEIKKVVKLLTEKVDNNISVKNIICAKKKLTMNAIACYLSDIGYAKTKEDAYEKYLVAGKVAFVQKECMTPEEAIQLIVDAGGIPVLAHPNRVNMTKDRMEHLIEHLAKCGLKGIECYCLYITDEEIRWYVTLCHKENLWVSAGSDFHKPTDLIGLWREENEISTRIQPADGLLLIDVIGGIS